MNAMESFVIPSIAVKKANITSMAVDAIVNPANSFGYMGGGVAGAIKKTGGSNIEDEAINSAPIQVGTAIATSAGFLPCKAVIHAPTMHNPGGVSHEEAVSCATTAALELSDSLGFKSIAIPAMGSGVGGLEISKCAKAVVGSIRSLKYKSIERIILVAFDDAALAAFEDAAGKKA